MSTQHQSVHQLVHSVIRTARQVNWYIGQVMGDAAYENYLTRHNRVHPDKQPLTQREFWRSRDTFNEENVQSGCC